MRPPPPTAAQRLEKLIADVVKAEENIKAGKRVDMRAMDAESASLHKILKTKPDKTLQPLLMRAVGALERLAVTIEQHVETLKSKH